MPFTRGFVNDTEWDDHFYKHGSEFGAITREEYKNLADAVFGLVLDEHTQEFIRARDSARIRASDITEAVCLLRRNGTISTYYSRRNRDKRKFPTIFDYARWLSRR